MQIIILFANVILLHTTNILYNELCYIMNYEYDNASFII